MSTFRTSKPTQKEAEAERKMIAKMKQRFIDKATGTYNSPLGLPFDSLKSK